MSNQSNNNIRIMPILSEEDHGKRLKITIGNRNINEIKR
jgi:hypothetical protein